jgi:hypothetical protein
MPISGKYTRNPYALGEEDLIFYTYLEGINKLIHKYNYNKKK